MKYMIRDDIEYVLEILEDAVENQDWELVTEAQQYMKDFLNGNPSKNTDEE